MDHQIEAYLLQSERVSKIFTTHDVDESGALSYDELIPALPGSTLRLWWLIRDAKMNTVTRLVKTNAQRLGKVEGMHPNTTKPRP